MENTVETQVQTEVLDDAALNPVQEQTDQIEPLAEALEAQPAQNANDQPPAKEPGWIRQRVDKAVSKAVRETEARMQAQFEATLAPIRESVWERQADALVASGEFKTRDRALEYVRLKGGVMTQPVQPEPQQPATQPRDAQGRFTAPAPQQQPANDPVIAARAQMLSQQADKIKARQGLDVMQAFNQDESIRQQVLSGNWDFYDVADALREGRMPSTVRSANGASAGATAIANMSEAQFQKLQENLAAGKIYDAR